MKLFHKADITSMYSLRFNLHKIFILLAGILIFSVSSAFAEMREIKVAAAVTPGFQALPNWRADFEKRLGYASRIFESEFQVKFKLVRYVKWQPKDESAEMVSLLDELRGDAPLTDVDMVIGLLHFKEAASQNMRDLHTIGQARPFTGHLIIRYPANKLFRVQEETVLVHELGHAFGAIHTDDGASIMSPAVDRQLPVRFDAVNRQIILKTRALNFKKGAESLPKNVLQVLLQSYLKMAGKNGSGDFFYSLGLFYLQLGQPDDALKAWKMAVSLEPENAELHFNLGALYYRTGDYDRAVPELSHAVSGARYAAQKMMQAVALIMLGEAYYQQDNMFAAYNAWTRAAAIQPRDIEIQANLAMIKLKQGQTGEAIATFQKILEQDSKNVKALTYLGMGLNQSGKSQEALQYLELALAQLNRQQRTRSQVSQLSSLYGEIGSIYLKMNRQREAFEHFQAACDLTSSVDCHKKLGMKLFSDQQWDAATREFAKVLQTEKDDAEIYGMLGTAMAQKGDQQNALGIFQEGLKYAKDNKIQTRLHRNIGNLFLSRKSYDLAETEFQLALSKDWSDAESHFGLAISQLGKDQAVAAINSLRDVLRLEPNNQRAKNMLESIQKNLNQQASGA